MQHSAMKENKDLACYFVTKHSWKGKYKRIFSVGTLGITTYNPQSLEITNQWPYAEFITIEPNVKSFNEFVIKMKKGERKKDAMRFSSDHRPDILTQALKFRNLFAERPPHKTRVNAVKLHWSERRVPVVLEANLASLDQVHPTNGRVLCSYDYKDMENFRTMDDVRGGLVILHGGYGRMHGFILEERDLGAFSKAVMAAAYDNVGIVLKESKERISHDFFIYNRLGKYSDDEHITSTSEFTVQKHSLPRHGNDPMRRLLCLSETCLVERDPATYHVVTCKPLCDVFALVRDCSNPQLLIVEFVKGFVCCYLSTDRDALIASILDGVRASGNRDVCVKMRPTDRGLRFGPFTVPVDEEVESQHMKFLSQPPSGMTFKEAVARFNANISYSGLLHAVTQDGLFAENKERLINGSLTSLISREGDQSEITAADLEAQFHALRRLVASKAGFQAFTELPRMRETLGRKVVTALKRNDDGVAHAALDTINALMTPMHDKYDIRQEQLNKQSIMSSKSFLDSLLGLFEGHVMKCSGALIITAMLDLLTFALCAPYSETTDGAHFDSLLEMVAERGRVMYRLFQHPSPAIVKGAGLVTKAIIEEGEPDVASKMQELALAEGALPKHLLSALFTQTTDARMLTNRQLSRHLVSLWITGSPIASALMKRVIPTGLMGYLDKEGAPPSSDIDRLHIRDNLKLALDHEEKTRGGRMKILERNIERRLDQVLVHWRARIGLAEKKRPAGRDERPVVLRKRRQRVRPDANWPMFYYQFGQDHTRPDLIWNYKTREELKMALEEQIRSFNQDCGGDVASSNGILIAWNHAEFEVTYPSLASEIRIGEYFLRLLLEEDALFEQKSQAEGDEKTDDLVQLKDSYSFFNDLYHRFLLTSDVSMRCLCLQAMAVVYGRCHETIGAFNDTRYIVNMLAKCFDRQERDRLLLFIQKLILNKRNVKELIEAGGIRVLMDLATLAHLHVSRAHTPQQSNVIEAAPNTELETEKEWHFSMPDKSSSGPHSFQELKTFFGNKTISGKTRCWAQGLEGWRPLESISQLKWSMVASGSAVLNESDLAILILNILVKICQYYPSKDEYGAVIRPVPKAKALLSNVTTLPHLVQLLLTFDPIIVEKVAVLLNLVVAENPYISRLYLTGVFFFICMYTGSNVRPIAHFLKYTHMQQAFRSEESTLSDITSRSILGHLLPEAMVCYLENYSADRFAAIFLGEFDSPEAIWSAEMRRLMIEKISGHLADFTPRLRTNNRALYQYCPIPVVSYPQLEHELFCNIYYLRHLCDTQRFPDWEIKNPVGLLKDILMAWKKEVEKQPPTMSVDDAFASLGLEKGVAHEESVIRKAYHRLAQKYHPDKNRDKQNDTRDLFEEVNKAYGFLCSRSRISNGPDPKNIVLILKTQSILFSRYKNVLEPYKYSGYPMLIKTIRMETSDDNLFSKSSHILSAAAEVAFHTVNTSALNAEEMRRENGIEVLQEAFTRCVSVVSVSSKYEDLAVQVCAHIAKFYAVAAQFEACRERIQEMPQIVKDMLRVLYYKNLPHLTCIVADTVSAFCIDFWLQTCMYQNGVLYHIIPPLFAYDFTLEEGGVERTEDSNQQEAANKMARFCVRACSRLAGYPHPSDPHVQAHRPVPASTPTSQASVASSISEALQGDAKSSQNDEGDEKAIENVQGIAGEVKVVGITSEMLKPASLNGDLKLLPLPPDNPAVKASLRALITPFVSRKLEEFSSDEILKYLTCNWETPYLLWDNTTRSELLQYLSEQQDELVRSGECDPNMGADFVFTIHKDELIIGDVFVRIYNEHPEFVLENPKSFAIDLLHFLNDQTQYLHSLLALQKNRLALKPEQRARLVRVESSLEGLRNVIKNNPGIEMQCIGHFKLLFALLRLTGCKKTQGLAVEVINSVTKNEECIKDIAASEVLVYLVMCCESLPECHTLILKTISPLMGTTKLTKEAVYRGILIYLIDLFCNSQIEEVRILTSEVLSRMMGDKLVGPRIRIILNKFLPSLFLDAMRDGPSEAVVLFERGAENPELIWNDNTRHKLCEVVKQMKLEFYANQLENPDAKWNVPENFEITYADLAGELVVAGVYLRLFIANPSWVLRRPRDFLTELFERWTQTAAATAGFGKPGDGERLELLNQALCNLLRAQPNLLNSVPQLGYVPGVLMAMVNPESMGPAIDLCFELSRNSAVIASMSTVGNCVENISKALKLRLDKADVVCECLHNIFNTGSDDLVSQALTCKLIPQLLGLLESGLEQVENVGSAKAHIVDALKAMQNSLLHGEQVRDILNDSRIWRDYKDQRHDLFIANTNIAGYLTGGTPQMAGYLMSAEHTSNRSGSSQPPPQDGFRQ